MPTGRPAPAPTTSLETLTQQLYDLHEQAHDPNLERWPEALLEVLAYTGRHHQALHGPPSAPARTAQITTRLTAIRVIRTHLDRLELQALEQARPERAHRQDQVPLQVLAQTLGVDTPGAVTHRMKRLQVATTTPHERRTPRRAAELAAARIADQVRRDAELTAERNRHHGVRTAALDVMHAHRAGTLRLTSDGADWIDDLTAFTQIAAPSPREMREERLLLSVTIQGATATTPQATELLNRALEQADSVVDTTMSTTENLEHQITHSPTNPLRSHR